MTHLQARAVCEEAFRALAVVVPTMAHGTCMHGGHVRWACWGRANTSVLVGGRANTSVLVGGRAGGTCKACWH